MNGRPFIRLALGPGASAVTRDGPPYVGQTNAGSLKFLGVVQPLEHAKELVHIGHVKPNAIVMHEKIPFTAAFDAANARFAGSRGLVYLTALDRRFTHTSLSKTRSALRSGAVAPPTRYSGPGCCPPFPPLPAPILAMLSWAGRIAVRPIREKDSKASIRALCSADQIEATKRRPASLIVEPESSFKADRYAVICRKGARRSCETE